MLPVSSKIKAAAYTVAAAAVGAALDSATRLDLTFLGGWSTVVGMAIVTGVGYIKTDTALAGWLRRYGQPDAAVLIAPKA